MPRRQQASFSRSANPSPFGKTTRTARTLLADRTKDLLGQEWRRLGFANESEFLRELIEIRVHGVEHIESLRRQRVRVVAGIEQEPD